MYMLICLGIDAHVSHASGGQCLIEAAFLKQSGPPILEQAMLLHLKSTALLYWLISNHPGVLTVIP